MTGFKRTMFICKVISWIIAICFMPVLTTALADTNVLLFASGRTVVESFNSFAGTFESLPVWISVSTNGTQLVNSSDANIFLGVSTGNVNKGGCYAWDIGNNERAIGWQPTDGNFTPGYILSVLRNSGTTPVKEINIAFEIVFKNNGSSNRSSYVSLEWSTDGTNFSSFSGMRFETPGQKNVNNVWERYQLNGRFVLEPPIQSGKRLWIRWWTDDVGGSGTRDEIGIRNFKLKAYLPHGMGITVR